MRFHVEPMNEVYAEQLTHWHYEPPYQMYNTTSDQTLIPSFVDPQNAYYSILDDGEMIAFCCFGKEAQVLGGDYGDVALDIGLGVRPDLTGQGKHGKKLVSKRYKHFLHKTMGNHSLYWCGLLEAIPYSLCFTALFVNLVPAI